MSWSRCRRWVAAVALLYCLGLVGIEVGPGRAASRAWAQDTTTTATAATEGGAAAGNANEGGARVDEAESFLHWMFRASGPIGVVIVAMSFYLIALVVWMSFQYRKAVAIPQVLVREVGDLLGQKQYTEAYHRLATDRSFLAACCGAGCASSPRAWRMRRGRWSWPTTT